LKSESVGRNRFIAPFGLAKERSALGLAKRRNKAIAPYDPAAKPKPQGQEKTQIEIASPAASPRRAGETTSPRLT
jgi:hypothetical protein